MFVSNVRKFIVRVDNGGDNSAECLYQVLHEEDCRDCLSPWPGIKQAFFVQKAYCTSLCVNPRNLSNTQQTTRLTNDAMSPAHII